MRTSTAFSGAILWLVLCSHLEAAHWQTSSAVDQITQHAAELMQSGDLKTAETELGRALKLAPNDVAALSLLGGALGMQGRLEESTQVFEKALRLAPANQDLRRNLAANQVRLGRACYRTHQKQKARAWLTQLQQLSADPDGLYLGGQVAMEASDWETAERLFVAAKNAAYSRPALLSYQLARIRYQTGRYRQSRELLEPIANSSESDGTVLNLLAWCYLKEGDEATGVKILSFAMDRFPAEVGNFLDLARLEQQRNRLDPALDVVQRGAAQHPESGPIFELKGELETAQGLHGPAVQSFQQAVRLNPRSPESLLGLALAQTNLLRNQEAVATFEKGLKAFPSDARFYAEYGKVLLLPWASAANPGAAQKAEQLLKRAIELDGSRAEPRFELGNQLVKAGRAAEAVPYLEKATSLHPRNAQAHFVLARAYRALGRTQDAEREMQLFEKLR